MVAYFEVMYEFGPCFRVYQGDHDCQEKREFVGEKGWRVEVYCMLYLETPYIRVALFYNARVVSSVNYLEERRTYVSNRGAFFRVPASTMYRAAVRHLMYAPVFESRGGIERGYQEIVRVMQRMCDAYAEAARLRALEISAKPRGQRR